MASRGAWLGRPRSNQLDDDRQHHIVFAKVRNYADISPVAGLILGSRKQDVDVQVDVVPRV